MSLQYVVDGYNVIRHASFYPSKKIRDPKYSLVEYIKNNRLCGSLKNKVIIVFDGFPDAGYSREHICGFEIRFSRETNADDVIKKMLEKELNPRNTLVVSDDREIKFFIRSLGAKPVSVEEFLRKSEGKGIGRGKDKNENIKIDLNYTQVHDIDEELKKLWLR
ncbi:MAG: NYN domain-containing protein [Candidatus Omnitrophota bacterium]|nr:NYN domain-containing protein [Candidatus Omnitrophota bacterium]MBU1928830.1 NYN domain-containing protein [Candidatus Omnitrophota bacterium]MBU2034440.1 NYN domain-containing protein [Candidatus Omnitrophota bacterium]MBU2258312.1 NYN domain-containing protein [Candidatus Omnitrophota bacterium]